jgi:hypothetical protein
MEFKYNRNKEDLLSVMKSKAKKKDLKITEYKDKVEIEIFSKEYSSKSGAVPVTFKGKFQDGNQSCTLSGKFYYGFYLYTLVIVAAILIIVRTALSLYYRHMGNLLLCGVVTALLAVVIIVVQKKSKAGKKLIADFLCNLNKK